MLNNMMLKIGIILVIASTLAWLILAGNKPLNANKNGGLFSLFALLFTSGLDGGLIMLPLTEFPAYANTVKNPEYGFTNPLAIEFGFWGFAVWLLYFVSTCYFCLLEPKVKFFQLPVVKKLNGVLILLTCAFSAALLLYNLPWYLPALANWDSSNLSYYLLTFIVLLLAVVISCKIQFIKRVSQFSLILFALLAVYMALTAKLTASEWLQTVSLLGDYFSHITHFAWPINDYHAFYLFWWFSWSIMIGQFTARFVNGLTVYQLMLVMLVLPSIPIAIWFCVLYGYYEQATELSSFTGYAMVLVAVLFVLNSLDAMIRLYSESLNCDIERLGRGRYILLHVALLSGLTYLYDVETIEIAWIGMAIIALYISCIGYSLLYYSGNKSSLIKRKLARSII